MASANLESQIDTVRRFSRTFTRTIGLLDETYLESPYNLSAVRVMYELAHRQQLTASQLSSDLTLDPGYLSRVVRQLVRDGLVLKSQSRTDRRQAALTLSGAGLGLVADLEKRSRSDLADVLQGFTTDERVRLVRSLGTAADLLSDEEPQNSPFIVRSHRPGDFGWIISRHAALYAEEFGWDSSFEAVVARIVADVLESFDHTCEHCWIAERHGTNIGSIVLVRHRERPGVAKLRLLLVEPSARGLGLGKYLVNECLRFARKCGYHTVTLWTYRELEAATHMYQSAGFHLISEAPQHAFGKNLMDQTWEISL